MNRREIELKIIYKPITELKESPKNPRKHTRKKITKLAKSIKLFGFITPILIDQNNIVIAGNARLQAAKKIGLEAVPTINIEHLTKEELKAYQIADNRLAEEATWDFEILNTTFNELIDVDFDLSLTGFDPPELDFIIHNNSQSKENDCDNKVPENKDIPERTKPGDLFKLGKHKLLCGNSLNETSYKVILGESKANLIITDPPYNVNVNGHVLRSTKHKEFAMASGEMTSSEFTSFLKDATSYLAKYSKDGSMHFICMDWRHIKELIAACESNYSELKNVCIWDKQNPGMVTLYRSQHELVFVYKNGPAPHTNNVQLGKYGRNRSNVWSYKGVNATNPESLEDLKLHPTVKPVSMIMDAILDCSNINDIVLDCFGGSGSTLIATEKTQRKARLIEIDPKYCDVIIHRFEELTGQKAELIDNYKEVNNG